MNEVVLNANSLRKSQNSQKASKRTHSPETWDRNAVKSVRAEMDVTGVAGGISGRVLCLGRLKIERKSNWDFWGSRMSLIATPLASRGGSAAFNTFGSTWAWT